MFILKVFVTVLFSGTLAFAGDASHYLSLGFSNDSKYFAFAQSGLNDGSGFPYASATIVDTAKNLVVANASVNLEEDSATEKMAVEKVLEKINLSRFGIKALQNLGQDLLVRLPTDYSIYKSTAFSIESWPEGGASALVPKYSLIITEKDVPKTEENKWCDDFGDSGNKMMSLNLVSLQEDNKMNIILQDDNIQPKSRICSFNYSVVRITKNAKSLVIIVKFNQVGFEGPNSRYMAVTGQPNL